MWRPSTMVLAIAVPLGAQLALSGCAAGGMGDQLPHAMGGLPQSAPARPDKPYAYPGVYDTPAARSTKPLDDTEQLRLQRELQGVRDRQEKVTADPDAPPPADQKPTKKNATGPKSGQATGAKTNP
ncbi:hypothetical protein DXH78_14045 [Undibacter mobilis]|uniref:Lipoprotein n=2 Tax=Undibacter mobilis TaxID=2292256 RepID=A0A371BDD8_9BRAD|nr:hypothetical protein DXH78_14045 [Undibacter mobilis]